MSAAREAIFAAIRRGLAARHTQAEPAAGAGRQSLLPPAYVREAADLTALFEERAKRAGATVARVARAADVPAEVARYLGERGLAGDVRLAEEPAFLGLAWGAAGLAAGEGLPLPMLPKAVVSRALAGVAENGSCAFTTRAQSRPVHNLLAETHFVVLSAGEIVPTMEDAWRRASAGGVPRSLAFITGPSRTGDIEMTLEVGVHGAVAMHLILVAEDLYSRLDSVP